MNNLVNEIRKIDQQNAGFFYKYFSSFKRKRNIADYSNVEILESDLNQAKNKAEKIRKFFKLIDDEGRCENIYLI